VLGGLNQGGNANPAAWIEFSDEACWLDRASGRLVMRETSKAVCVLRVVELCGELWEGIKKEMPNRFTLLASGEADILSVCRSDGR